MKKIAFTAVMLASLSAFAGDPAAAAAKPTPSPAFDKLKALVGEWKTDGEQPTTVTYKLASNESALIETMMPGTPHEMITVYHRDNDKVAMTHYCAGGNQPHMAAKKLDGEKLKFDLVRVGNIPNPKTAEFMSGLTITFKDGDHVTQEWLFKKGTKTEPKKFELTRATN
jgi:hypothetical protein